MSDAILRSVELPTAREHVTADLVVPHGPVGLVIVAHGSGSSRDSPRNRAVARALNALGLATMLADLITPGEEAIDRIDGHHRFDIALLGHRLVRLIDWVRTEPSLRALPLGLFGASTGAAAALAAAAERPHVIRAVVSRGGRPDLAGAALPRVQAPTLLLIGGSDAQVIELNEWARRRMRCHVRLEVVPRAGHLFQEPGALEKVAAEAGRWFVRHLDPLSTGVSAEQTG